MAENANEIEFELLDMLNQQVAYAECRIDRNTVPSGLYVYEIRCDDKDDSVMREIAPHVAVNFIGTIICKEPVDLIDGNCRMIDYGDYGFAGGCLTLLDYVNGF